MNDPLLKKIKLKSLEEIVARARDIISRHRRRFISRNLRPCPNNCTLADWMGRKVVGCSGCESHDPNTCLRSDKFVPVATKEQLALQFAQELRDPGVLLRDYRDVVVFFWVLGAFDEESKVDEEIIPLVERKGNEPKVNSGNSGDRNGGAGNGDSEAEPNYNRAESNYSGIVAGFTRPDGMQSSPKPSRKTATGNG